MCSSIDVTPFSTLVQRCAELQAAKSATLFSAPHVTSAQAAGTRIVRIVLHAVLLTGLQAQLQHQQGTSSRLSLSIQPPEADVAQWIPASLNIPTGLASHQDPRQLVAGPSLVLEVLELLESEHRLVLLQAMRKHKSKRGWHLDQPHSRPNSARLGPNSTPYYSSPLQFSHCPPTFSIASSPSHQSSIEPFAALAINTQKVRIRPINLSTELPLISFRPLSCLQLVPDVQGLANSAARCLRQVTTVPMELVTRMVSELVVFHGVLFKYFGAEFLNYCCQCWCIPDLYLFQVTKVQSTSQR
ncbi:hypothetical protein CCM_02726 [Cordyceps militaris CM01]|uniref:Uncharacterized protein n=1 Tax=Cordyceps militaris (strain CM01) TaxID=983644 RepID=G3JBE8_CORMM|nr:uncharacterized protein CCM_02726 [Cordyceps militaris CM01]EGX94455.1 hypothetical protein CCM_02726 [Cordyceps militaris CM01]